MNNLHHHHNQNQHLLQLSLLNPLPQIQVNLSYLEMLKKNPYIIEQEFGISSWKVSNLSAK